MGFIDKYPYTDFHELNLDWILARITELGIRMDDFTAVNTITYAGAWDITQQYPAWTVVSYQNKGFISTQPVPAGVNVYNTNYWRVIMDLSAILDSMDDRIDAVEAEIDEIGKYNQTIPTKIVCIGDSYGMKITDNWPKQLQSIFQLPNNRFNNQCVGNAGFVGYTGYRTFLEQLQNVSDDMSTYTHIIICGGFNDAYGAGGASCSTADLTNQMIACRDYIAANFTNAKVYIGFAGYATSMVNDAAGFNKADDMMSQCATMKGLYDVIGGAMGWTVMSNVSYILKYSSYFDNTDFTNNVMFHPSASGNYALASCIASYMQGGDAQIAMKNVPTYTIGTGLTTSQTTGQFVERQATNKYEMLFKGMTVTCSLTMHDFSHGWRKLVDITPGLLFPCSDNTIYANGFALVTEGGNAMRIPYTARFYNNSIEVILAPYNDTNGAVTQIVFMPAIFYGQYGEC